MKWKTLEHNGVLFPPKYNYQEISIKINGKKIRLTEIQEEMAWAWTKKRETVYVKDKIFIKNFLKDFLKNFEGKYHNLSINSFDFSEMIKIQEKEKEYNSRPEIKKKLAKERKERREILKEKHGYAIVNGIKTEVGNYMVEPASIFMGRGEHPSRGKWKRRAEPNEIVLNLGKESPIPPCPIKDKTWKKIENDKESTWLAKWHDKLTNKDKYVWLSESSTIRQEQDKAKYEQAIKLRKSIKKIRNHIENNLESSDKDRRKVATVAYLIDKLALRVGDEKDTEDEADTVGATTLRIEHVKISGNKIEFDFLGKDSVRWKKTIEEKDTKKGKNKDYTTLLINNLEEFTKGKKEEDAIFDKISSSHVNKFLSECMKGITAKVFRTYHATNEVIDYLEKCGLQSTNDEYIKIYHAKMANLEAARQCNHKKTPTKNWEENMKKKENKINEVNKELRKIKKVINNQKYNCVLCNNKLIIDKELVRCLNEESHKLQARKSKNSKSIKKLERQKIKIGKEKERLNRKQVKLVERHDKLKRKFELDTKTKEYNLNTSLKNYIDPRIYKKWSEKVEVDWNKIYPKSMQKKFIWIEKENT